MVSLSPSAEVRYLAAEVACLLQGEDEGAHDLVGAPFVVALQLDGLALARLALVLELEEVAVATEAEHSLDGVGEVERAALARAQHCAGLLVSPFDGELDGVGIANLRDPL